jgi:putative endonuclease
MMVIPSQVPDTFGKGVETRRRASKPGIITWYDEGIVQTPKPFYNGAAKAVVGTKILWTAMSVTVQLRSGAQTTQLNGSFFFMFYVYILYSEKCDRYYVGFSADVPARLNRHNAGMVKATRNCIPNKICASKQFQTELEARREELRIKKQKSRKYIEWLLKGNW